MIDYNLSAESVCATVNMFGLEAKLKGHMEFCDNFNIENDVVIIIGIIGDKKYNVAYSMAKKTAQGIAGLMMGSDGCEMNEIGRSAMGELVNMISGNLAVSFFSHEYAITLPTVISGNNVSCVMQSFESNKLTFETCCGSLEVYFALEG